MFCYGCKGLGWVETAGGAMVHKCPICLGAGWLPDIITSNANPTDKCPACGGGRNSPGGTGCRKGSHYGTY